MRLICGSGYFCRPSLPPFKFNACNRHSTPSLCIVIDVGCIFNVKCMILITLSLFIHSLIISSVYLSLYLYLYTDYYSVYRTFICIAHLPFQLLSFRNSAVIINWSSWKGNCEVSFQFIGPVRPASSDLWHVPFF